MKPTVTWFVVDEESISDELRHAAKAVHKSCGKADYIKYFRKVFISEARKAGLIEPKEKPTVVYRFGQIAIRRTM